MSKVRASFAYKIYHSLVARIMFYKMISRVITCFIYKIHYLLIVEIMFKTVVCTVMIPVNEKHSKMVVHSQFRTSWILKIRRFVVQWHILYSFNIWVKVVSPIERKYIEGFCMWTVCFDINWLFPNITHILLMSWHLSEYFLIYYIIDCFLCRFHVTFNDYK